MSKRDGLCPQEHEVIAMLHACNDAIPLEILPHGSGQHFVISFPELHPTTKVLS